MISVIYQGKPLKDSSSPSCTPPTHAVNPACVTREQLLAALYTVIYRWKHIMCLQLSIAIFFFLSIFFLFLVFSASFVSRKISKGHFVWLVGTLKLRFTFPFCFLSQTPSIQFKHSVHIINMLCSNPSSSYNEKYVSLQW